MKNISPAATIRRLETIRLRCVVSTMAKAKAKAPPRGGKLKVFKTPIGFHDAYVAAPSRKAALAAWGSGTDLFSAGIAEPVTDQGEGAKAALARPGEVVRVARHAEKDRPSPRPAVRSEPSPRWSERTAPAGGRGGMAVKPAKPKPRPSRTALGRAEAALSAIEGKQAAERAELAKEEDRLAKKRRAMEQRHAKARDKAEAARADAERRYRQAIAEWVG